MKIAKAPEVEIVNAIESNMFGHMSYFARHLSTMEVIDTPDFLIINSGLPSDTFNYVCRPNLPELDVDSRIDFAFNYFREQQLPAAWWISASSKPKNLADKLENHGLKRTEEAVGMALDLNQLCDNKSLPEGLSIRRVTNIDELQNYANIISSCWNPPDTLVIEFYQQAAEIAFRPESPVHFYLGYLENQPVATCELFLDAGVAGIYGLVTLEKFRKRGIGTAMALAALWDAKKQGYQTAILQASEDGKNLYSHLGFKSYCEFYIYQ